jgi:hypothetical protein
MYFLQIYFSPLCNWKIPRKRKGIFPSWATSAVPAQLQFPPSPPLPCGPCRSSGPTCWPLPSLRGPTCWGVSLPNPPAARVCATIIGNPLPACMPPWAYWFPHAKLSRHPCCVGRPLPWPLCLCVAGAKRSMTIFPCTTCHAGPAAAAKSAPFRPPPRSTFTFT